MKQNYSSLIKRRLVLINAVIIITSIVGILSILEVARGVGFHESNIQHLGLTSKLKENISALEGRSGTRLNEIRQVLTEIRKEPETCLSNKNPIMVFGLKILKTEDIFTICQDDSDVINEALLLISRYESGTVSEADFLKQFKTYSDTLHGHSFEFRPLVSRTVDILLIIAGIILVLKGLAVTLITVISSRSIMSQFQSIVNMEHQLRSKNTELNNTIEVLEAQKDQLAVAREKSEFNALHDTLTGLPNRRYLNEFLSSHNDQNTIIAVLHIDIDGFKQINDTRGHKAGDFVLASVSERLKGLSNESTFAARVGGDEFVMLMVLGANSNELQAAEAMASNVVAQLKIPVNYEGFFCRFSASVGIAICQNNSGCFDNAETILVDADLALYHQKLNGKNGYAIYDQELRASITEKKLIADAIHEALEARAFEPFFQLQVYSNTFDVAGVEALVRWQHPERGLLTPDKFLPIAEEMGVMGDLDRQVFDAAYQCFTDWEEMGLEVPRLSVNMSLNRLMDPLLQEHLEQYDLSHGRVSFELLESILLDGCDEKMQQAVSYLIGKGIELELDDFGSGHASVLGLLALKPTRFKIDRQLIESVNKSASQKALVRSIIDIGKSLDVEVTAEGVETLDQAAILRDLGCNILQGYYFSKPMSNEDIIKFMKARPAQQAA